MLNFVNKKGFISAFLTAILWGLYAVLMKIGVVHFKNLHPFVFILQAYLVGSLALLIASGPGSLSRATLQNISTWSYGAFNLLNNVFLVAAFCYAISATSATLLLRMGILISILMDCMFVKDFSLRNKFIYLGLLFGLIIVSYGVDVENAKIAITLVFLSALMQVIQVKISERHKQNNMATGSIRDELRVTGFVTSISALIYMAFVSLVVFLEVKLDKIVPTSEQILDLDSLIYASLVGLLVVSLNKYLVLISTKTLGATNFLTIVAFTPLFTMIFEHICVALKILDTPTFSIYEIVGGALVVLSIAIITNHTVKGIKLNTKETERLIKAKELVTCCDIHFKNDLTKILSDLKITKTEYNSIKELNDFVVSDELLNKIKNNFSETVAFSDSLTGLQSRVKFLSKLNNINRDDTASIMFVDLNKFKPVNDTYGHKVGDIILQGAAKRLDLTAYGVTRLGGDEFCLLLEGITKQDAIEKVQEIKSLIEEDFDIEGLKINISASIGVANYPEDTKEPSELIMIADSMMYKDKNSR